MWKLLCLVACLAPIHGASLGERTGKKLYTNHRLVEVTPTTKEQADFLRDLETTGQLGLDFWLSVSLNHITRIRVPPTVYDRFLELLEANGLTHTIIIESVQDLIDDPPAITPYKPGQYDFTNGLLDHTAYHPMSSITNFIIGLPNSFTGVTSGYLQHSTAGGLNVPYVQITGGSGSNKKRIVIEGGAHAREWINPASVLYFIDKMLHQRSLPGSEAEYLYNNFEWFIVPVMNPEGYEYSRSTDRLWRKNRNSCLGGRGIDLNRNFASNFGGTGSSNFCFSETYRGPSAFSEPESQNMRDLVTDIQNNRGAIDAYISVHSYSQYLLIPYGWNTSPPSNDAEIRRITNLARDAIAAQGPTYIVGTPPEILYEASGTSSDWARVIGIPYTMTYELRPSSGTSNGFVLPATEIIPNGQDVWVSMHTIASEL